MDTNATAEKKRGSRRRRNGGRLLWSVSGTLSRSFWSAHRKDHFFSAKSNRFSQFNPKALVQCVERVQKIGILLLPNGKKLFYKTEQLNRITLS